MILLRAFVDEGEDVVSRWYREHAGRPKARAELDARMTYLRQQRREGWTRDRYDVLRDGVGEVRFKAERIQYRALGFFGPGRNEFTFCFFATKTNRFEPMNAIDIAVRRRIEVERNPALAVRLVRWGQS